MLCFYPRDLDVLPGGVAAVSYYLSRALARLGEIDLHLVCCQHDAERDLTVERDGLTVHFLRDSFRFSQVTGQRPQRRKMGATLRRLRPDLVHAQGIGVPAAAALDFGGPRALTVHGLFWREPNESPAWTTRVGNRIRARAYPLQIGRFRNQFVTSDYVGRSLPPGEYRKFRINNPVGDELFAIENRPESPRVLVVGGLRARKDPLTSVAVMARTLEAVPDATMTMLGPASGTPLDAEVVARIRALGLQGRVRVLGLVSNATLHAEYERASVLLLPSREESAPVAIAEACAAGVPQVGTDAGGIPDMIRPGETGWVERVGDVDALAQRVIRILTDQEHHDELARGSVELARREYAAGPIARQTLDAYRAILDR